VSRIAARSESCPSLAGACASVRARLPFNGARACVTWYGMVRRIWSGFAARDRGDRDLALDVQTVAQPERVPDCLQTAVQVAAVRGATRTWAGFSVRPLYMCCVIRTDFGDAQPP
jgi:hypothetical protein